ncbi:MAG TPA: alpha/beta hydrolase [Spirochaetota bacterium]|nr:alpha/beta hydrolase [Spirochaetota bacterium]
MKRLKKILLVLLSVPVILITVFYLWIFVLSDMFKKELTAAERKNTDGKLARLECGTTWYETTGPDNGDIIVFVHGATIPAVTWDANFSNLAAAGFKVIRYDALGRGLSDRPATNYTAELFTAQLKQLLTFLNIKQKINLCSLSFGGPVTAAFSHAFPQTVRKIIMIAPAAYSLKKPGLGETLSHIGWILARYCSEDKNHALYKKKLAELSDKMAFQFAYKGIAPAGYSLIKYRNEQQTARAFRFLGETGIPVLLIWGTDDPVVKFSLHQAVLKAVPQARLIPVPRGGHIPHYMFPQLVNKKISTFLRN